MIIIYVEYESIFVLIIQSIYLTLMSGRVWNFEVGL